MTQKHYLKIEKLHDSKPFRERRVNFTFNGSALLCFYVSEEKLDWKALTDLSVFMRGKFFWWFNYATPFFNISLKFQWYYSAGHCIMILIWFEVIIYAFIDMKIIDKLLEQLCPNKKSTKTTFMHDKYKLHHQKQGNGIIFEIGLWFFNLSCIWSIKTLLDQWSQFKQMQYTVS